MSRREVNARGPLNGSINAAFACPRLTEMRIAVRVDIAWTGRKTDGGAWNRGGPGQASMFVKCLRNFFYLSFVSVFARVLAAEPNMSDLSAFNM